MKEYFAFDRVLKDIFQTDRSMLMEFLTGGVRVQEFLNVEFQQVMERRADLVALLEDGTLFHSELQGYNDSDIACRMGIYALLMWQCHHRPINQVVIYAGAPPMNMPSQLNVGTVQVNLRLIDIREIECETFLRGDAPGDLALAMLAKGGTEHLVEILRRASQLTGNARIRVLTQLILLSGLRGISERLKMEMKLMGSFQIDIRENAILREVWEEVLAEGEANGEARGKAAGELAALSKTLRWQLQAKFQTIPEWAGNRIANATAADLERWFQNSLTAESIEAALCD